MAAKRNKGKREAIIDAAVIEFSKNGYHNTRMEEIANTAGIGKGTIYEYFDSKLHLFQAMMEDSLQVYYQRLEDQELDNLSVRERLELLIQSHLRFCLERKDLTRVLFWEAEAPDRELVDWALAQRKDKIERTKALLLRGIDHKEIRDDLDLHMLSIVIIHSMAAFWFPLVMEDWDIEPRTLAWQYTDLLMNGLKR